MKKSLYSLTLMLLALALLLSLSPAALAEGDAAVPGEEAPLIDEEALNQWIAEYRKAHNLEYDWQDLSIGFCYTATGDCWFYNADIFMYSASLYKVPVSMLVAEKEAAGEVDWSTRIQGSTLEFLETSALIKSSNDCGRVLVSYLGGNQSSKCSEMSIGYASLPEDYYAEDFYRFSYYSARYMTQVMLTLKDGGETRFPHVLESLLQAQPDEYLNLTLKGKYPVAQKYGAYKEPNGHNNNHIAAIVFTPTPIIVVVMTRNIGDYQWRMAEIGAYLADYSLALDEELRQRKEAAAAAAAAAVTPAPTESPTPAASDPSEPAGDDAQLSDSARQDAPDAPERDGGFPWAIAFAAVVFVLLAAALLIRRQQEKKRRRRRRRAAVSASASRNSAASAYKPKH